MLDSRTSTAASTSILSLSSLRASCPMQFVGQSMNSMTDIASSRRCASSTKCRSWKLLVSPTSPRTSRTTFSPRPSPLCVRSSVCPCLAEHRIRTSRIFHKAPYCLQYGASHIFLAFSKFYSNIKDKLIYIKSVFWDNPLCIR